MTPIRPSKWLVLLVLAIVGLIDGIYLTWVKLAGAYASCFGIGNCEFVNQSRFSELWGYPIALFGAATYLVLAALLVGERLQPAIGEASRLGVFGITTFGLLYSAYLTYIEVAILRAICPYCVLSAIVMLAMWILSISRLGSAEAVRETA